MTTNCPFRSAGSDTGTGFPLQALRRNDSSSKKLVTWRKLRLEEAHSFNKHCWQLEVLSPCGGLAPSQLLPPLIQHYCLIANY